MTPIWDWFGGGGGLLDVQAFREPMKSGLDSNIFKNI